MIHVSKRKWKRKVLLEPEPLSEEKMLDVAGEFDTHFTSTGGSGAN